MHLHFNAIYTIVWSVADLGPLPSNSEGGPYLPHPPAIRTPCLCHKQLNDLISFWCDIILPSPLDMRTVWRKHKRYCRRKFICTRYIFMVGSGISFRSEKIPRSRLGTTLSCLLFRGLVRNEISRVCFNFCSAERNSEHFSLPRNCSERNSAEFLFFGIAGIPSEWTNCSVYSVFRGMIFLSQIANPTYFMAGLFCIHINCVWFMTIISFIYLMFFLTVYWSHPS